MRTLFFTIFFFVAVLALACDTSGDDFPTTLGECPSDTTVTWSTVEPLFASNCNRCHASSLTGTARAYAPVGVDYDTEDLAAINADDSWDRIAKGVNDESGGMPNDDPISSQADALLIREWLSCQSSS